MRDREIAASWQRRFDGMVLLAAVIAVIGVALQPLPGDPHDVGLALSWAAWLIFATEAMVMLSVTPFPGQWLRAHLFEEAVVVVAFPLWPLLAYDLLLTELVPALSVLDGIKLAKVAESARVVQRRLANPAWQPAAVTLTLAITAAVAVEVITR